MNKLIKKICKVCILTTVHPLFDTRIFHKESKSLVMAGYAVALVVQHDKFETIDGMRIVPLIKPRNRFERMFSLTWQAFRLGLKENANIYHFHDPELMPVGIVLRILGKRVIYDVHEDVSGQIIDKYWIPKFLRKLVSFSVLWVEKFFAKFFDGIVAVTPRIAQKFPQKKTTIVQNFPILEHETNNFFKLYQQRANSIAYVGGLTEGRGIFEMIMAIEHIPINLEVKLILGGEFNPRELKADIVKLTGWTKVDERGWLSRKDVLNVLGESRIGLVVLHPLPNYLPSYPVKMFEYMNAGLPVVASNFPLWQEIIENAKCGICIDPLNPQAIAGAVQWLLEHPQEAEVMGKNGQRVVKEKYNWDNEAKKLLAFYERICSKKDLK